MMVKTNIKEEMGRRNGVQEGEMEEGQRKLLPGNQQPGRIRSGAEDVETPPRLPLRLAELSGPGAVGVLGGDGGGGGCRGGRGIPRYLHQSAVS